MKVCIAEKPSVAETIATILGARTRRNGYWEGNGYQVTWTFGHLCTLKAPHEYTDAWRHWRMDYLPMIPPRFGITLIDDEGIRKQFAIIEQLFASAECVINCGDAGQEGELIQRWVMMKAGVKCPVYRLWVSSLTDEALREAFAHLEPQSKHDNLYQAALARAIGDWLLGMNITRLYTLRYAQQKQVLSIGRVQTPTLALIVKRHHEIVNFVPTQYWELKTLYREVSFAATHGRYETLEAAEEALRTIESAPFTIQDVQQKPGKELPPRLFDLTSLQVLCNKKFGMGADETLRIIQTLYEKKVTTYPRVDTTYLSDDIYPKCPEILSKLRGYESLTASLIGAKLPKSKKVFDNKKVTDHHAIIPTNVPAINLSEQERKVYDLVVRRFIAVFYPDCKVKTTTVLGDVAEVGFKATGKVIVDPGWRVVFADPADSRKNMNFDTDSKEEEADAGIMPEFVVGESGPHIPSCSEKWTQPPRPYTEATLLRAMETAGKLCDDDELRDAMKENGLGRPSTRAEIIKTLYKRRYVRLERQNMIPTQTGIELISIIRDEILKSAELTGQWESKLRSIDRGEYQASTFIEELKEMVGRIIYGVKTDHQTGRVTYVPDTAETKASGKSSKSKKESATAENKPSKPKTERKPRKTKKEDKKPYTLATLPQVCPACGQGQLLKGRTAYGCSRYREGCKFVIPFSDIEGAE